MECDLDKRKREHLERVFMKHDIRPNGRFVLKTLVDHMDENGVVAMKVRTLSRHMLYKFVETTVCNWLDKLYCMKIIDRVKPTLKGIPKGWREPTVYKLVGFVSDESKPKSDDPSPEKA